MRRERVKKRGWWILWRREDKAEGDGFGCDLGDEADGEWRMYVRMRSTKHLQR